jgi:Rad3-related DNA helicase
VPAADVVLAPYNAVLMPDARESLGIQLQDAVLVFDEAHNLLNALNSAHSTSVTGELPCVLLTAPDTCSRAAGCSAAVRINTDMLLRTCTCDPCCPAHGRTSA